MQRLLGWLKEGATVVTATPRQARHLRWHYDRQQSSEGRGGWHAPTILSLTGWLEQSWEQGVLTGAPSGRVALLTGFQQTLVWRQIIRDARLQLSSPGHALQLARRSRSLVADWQIEPPALRTAANREDERQFADWLDAYLARCDSLEAADHDAIAAILAADFATGRLRAGNRLLFVGFPRWTPRLAGLLKALQSGGWEAGVYQPAAALREPRSSEFASAEEELDAVTQWAVAQLDSAGRKVIGLVTPDLRQCGAAYRRRALDVLQPDWRGQPTAQQRAGPTRRLTLADSGIVRIALLTLELTAGSMDYRQFGELLRSRYLAGGVSEAQARAQADLWLRAESQPRLDLWNLQAELRRRAPRFGRLLAAMLNEVARARNARGADAWVSWLNTCLRAAGWPGDSPLTEDEQQAAADWADLLEAFAAAGSVLGELKLADLCSTLRSLAAETPWRVETAVGDLQLLTPEEAIGHVFDGLWIAGLHTDAWPPDPAVNPLVPLNLQRRAGIPEATATGAGQDANRLLRSLLTVAPDVTVSSARSAGELILTPSPLHTDLPSATATAPRKPSVREALLWSAETEIVADDPAPPVTGVERARGGSRLLQLQAICPARAFFELRLGATELAVPSFGIGPLLRGQATHIAVETLYREIATRGLSPRSDAAAAHVPAAASAGLQGSLPPRDPLTPVLLKLEEARLIRLLHELLQLDGARPPFRVVAAERDLSAVVGPLTLRLKPDRVDELADGRRLVIDYKTGQGFSPSAWLRERPDEPQLPLYALAQNVNGIAVIRLAVDGVHVLGVADDPGDLPKFRDVEKLTAGAQTEWGALLDRWHTALTALAEEFAAGSCAIDANCTDPARGQYATLTRIYELGAAVEA